MTEQRSDDIIRSVFYRYYDQIMTNFSRFKGVELAFETGRMIGFMQKTLEDELKKEVTAEQMEG